MTDLTWMTHPDRPCATTEPECYFPGERITRREIADLCAGCPVKAPCRNYARQERLVGVWGGVLFPKTGARK